MHDIEEKTLGFLPIGIVSELSESSPAGWPARSGSLKAGLGEVQTEKNATVRKVFKRTTHYNCSDMAKKDLFCFDDSQADGEYFSLGLKTWKESEFTIDEHKRINVGRTHAGENVRLFIQKDFETLLNELSKEGLTLEQIEEFYNNEKDPKITDCLISFNRRIWSELRRVRGESRGLPLEVNTNGTIWIGDRAEQEKIKIFERRD